jgi:hypothetical protein
MLSVFPLSRFPYPISVFSVDIKSESEGIQNMHTTPNY